MVCSQKVPSLFFKWLFSVGDCGSKYNLQSVIVHRGGLRSGHYYAYVDPKITGDWFLFNDESVQRATEKEAVEDNFGDEENILNTRIATVLTYIKDSEECSKDQNEQRQDKSSGKESAKGSVVKLVVIVIAMIGMS